MLINIDIKGLEVVCAAYLSKDEVLCKELTDGVDIHQDNQTKFGLPSRLIAKIFKFRLLYGGTTFHTDPDFMAVSSNRKFWDNVIEKYYEKYRGIGLWHKSLTKEVQETGKIQMLTGRSYKFEYRKNYKGELELPLTIIKNYPVQGFGADVMSVLRVDFFSRFKKNNIKGLLINTVHDSIVIDLEKGDVSDVVELFRQVCKDFPENFKKLFGVEFNLDINFELEFGKNLMEMETYEH